MADVALTFACPLYDRMLPLYTGEVKPAGIDFKYATGMNLRQAVGESRQIFDQMGGGQQFDISEMSASEFISRKSAGDCPFVALPVFPSRMFRHGFISINRRAGIRGPKDLEGKRIGVTLYTQTAAVEVRGILQHEYGVDLSTLRWIQGALEKPGPHGRPGPIPPLLKAVSIEENKTPHSLAELLARGDIDAVVSHALPANMKSNPDLGQLFPNYREVEKEYYKRTGIFPIMHLIVIRRDVCERHPFIAASLYDAFCQAKDIAVAAMKSTASAGILRYMLPWLMADADEIDEIFGDPWPYGVEPNRRALQSLITYMVEQFLIPAPVRPEELFVPL
jgi:4,5-dihydroxyphthalate decarboxylase